MDVKRWLSRAKRIDEQIDRLVNLRDAERERIMKVTQTISGDIVQTTKDPHKFDKLAEYEDRLDQMIDRLYDTKTEILDVIAQITDSRYRDILIGRYLDGLTFEEIAVQIKYSYKQTCRLHGRALLKVLEVLDEKDV